VTKVKGKPRPLGRERPAQPAKAEAPWKLTPGRRRKCGPRAVEPSNRPWHQRRRWGPGAREVPALDYE